MRDMQILNIIRILVRKLLRGSIRNLLASVIILVFILWMIAYYYGLTDWKTSIWNERFNTASSKGRNQIAYPSPFELLERPRAQLRFVEICTGNQRSCRYFAAGTYKFIDKDQKTSWVTVNQVRVPFGLRVKLLDAQGDTVGSFTAGEHVCSKKNNSCEGVMNVIVKDDIREVTRHLKKCVTGKAHCNYPIVHTLPSTMTRKKQLQQIHTDGYAIATPEYPRNDIDTESKGSEKVLSTFETIRRSLSVDLDDDAAPGVTLVSQFSVNRLSRFEDALEAWPGPISVVM
jgi:hypothetical protein